MLELLRALNWTIRPDLPWPTKRDQKFDFVLVGEPGIFALWVYDGDPEGVEEAAAGLSALLDDVRVRPVVCRGFAALGNAHPDVLYCTPETALDLLIGLPAYEDQRAIRAMATRLRDLVVPIPPEPEPEPEPAVPVVAPPKSAPPKVEPPKPSPPKVEAPKPAQPKVEPPKVEAPKPAQPKVEPPKVEAPKVMAPPAQEPTGRPAPAVAPAPTPAVKPAPAVKPLAAPVAAKPAEVVVPAKAQPTAMPKEKPAEQPRPQPVSPPPVVAPPAVPVAATPPEAPEAPAAEPPKPKAPGRHRSEKPRFARRTPPPPPAAAKAPASTLEMPTALVPPRERTRGGNEAAQRFDNSYVYVPEPIERPGALKREFRAKSFLAGIVVLVAIAIAAVVAVRAWPQLAGLIKSDTNPSAAFGQTITTSTTPFHPKLGLSVTLPQRGASSRGTVSYAVDLTVSNLGATTWPLPSRGAFVLVDSLGESHGLAAINGVASSRWAGSLKPRQTWSGRLVFQIQSGRTPMRLRFALASDGSDTATWHN